MDASMNPSMDLYQPPFFFRAPGDNRICSGNPNIIHSPAIWDQNGAKHFLAFALPRLQLQLAIIFVFTFALHNVFKRFNLPRIVAEMMCGFIIGPTFLGRYFPTVWKSIFSSDGNLYIGTLAKVGYMYLMFLIGVKMDPSKIKASQKKAWIIGIVSTVLPVTVGLHISPFVAAKVGWIRNPAIRFIIGTQTIAQFPVVVGLLTDLKIMNTELGHLALTVALIRTLLSILLSMQTTYLRVTAQGSAAVGAQSAAIYFTWFLFTLYVLRPIFRWMIRRTPEGKQVRDEYIAFICCMVLASAVISDNVGVLYHFGPICLGLIVPVGPPLGSTLVDRLDTMVTGWLAPLLFTFCSLQSDLFEIYDMKFQKLLIVVLVLSNFFKFAIVFIPTVICKVPLKDSIALSLILSAEGNVELAGYLAYRENDTLDLQTFSTVTGSVLVCAIIIPILVRTCYDHAIIYRGYNQRNLVHSSEETELKVLVSAHRIDDAIAAGNLLEGMHPTKGSNELGVYVIHLLELAGRASPLLINHQLGQKSSSRSGSRSQEIIDLFRSYESKFPHGAFSTQMFTALSLPKFMHDDICLMAFEKQACFIILPFHRKWSAQGRLILDNTVVRSINQNVLNMAPCSVGILIDRRKILELETKERHRMAIIFMGGKDDREALAVAKRLARTPDSQLTIIRFIAMEEWENKNAWDAVLDMEFLKDVKLKALHQGLRISYKEENVKDGADLASLVHTIAEVYDLIIVGRHGIASESSPMLNGLSEWMDLPELGPIGDMLASSDIRRPVSALIVQHQSHLHNK
ncbi:cation/H(+) antiporter 4-like [Impatiens glandulifera]|uniref:cation/H(+) antiporter 4-like n=1 Tax=Impatiens glandulifera TaxID=253017 RepID=UPI001FB17CC1|nr:cation/H(+) antiporter 4-like [Impatiens glandulifera]